MREGFRIWLIVFGAVCACIAGAHLLFGQATYIGGGEVNATMDSDLRFYSLLFVAYGLAFIWAAQDIDGRARAIEILNALFFLGGLTRLLAWAASGQPHWFYVAMTIVELVVPIANHFILRAVTARSAQPAPAP